MDDKYVNQKIDKVLSAVLMTSRHVSGQKVGFKRNFQIEDQLMGTLSNTGAEDGTSEPRRRSAGLGNPEERDTLRGSGFVPGTAPDEKYNNHSQVDISRRVNNLK